ncbi:MAG: hypothetical protein ACXAB2_14410 [Candidatus Hodarchaeales archaeon]|jgi:hypothetical protein
MDLDRYISELDEELDTIEKERPQLDRLTIDIQKALNRYKYDTFIIPFTLVAKLFVFEVDEKGNLQLREIVKDYWKAIELYILLQFRENKESSNRILVSARFLKKTLCCRYEAIERAIKILKEEKLIKSRKQGQKIHAVKHYITMVKAV